MEKEVMLKIKFRETVKKMKASNSFSDLKKKVQIIFPFLKSVDFHMHYLEEESYVTLTDDQDVERMIKEALRSNPAKTLKLLVTDDSSSGDSFLILESMKSFEMQSSTIFSLEGAKPTLQAPQVVVFDTDQGEGKKVEEEKEKEPKEAIKFRIVDSFLLEEEEASNESGDEENIDLIEESVVLVNPYFQASIQNENEMTSDWVAFPKAEANAKETNSEMNFDSIIDRETQSDFQPSFPKGNEALFNTIGNQYPHQQGNLGPGKNVEKIPTDKMIIKRIKKLIQDPNPQSEEDIKKILSIRLKMGKELIIRAFKPKLFVLRFKKEKFPEDFTENDAVNLEKLEKWLTKKEAKENIANDKESQKPHQYQSPKPPKPELEESKHSSPKEKQSKSPEMNPLGPEIEPFDFTRFSSKEQEAISKFIENRVEQIINQRLEDLVQKRVEQSFNSFFSTITSNPSFLQPVPPFSSLIPEGNVPQVDSKPPKNIHPFPHPPPPGHQEVPMESKMMMNLAENRSRAQNLNSVDAVHYAVECSSCSAHPIRGLRVHCNTCNKDYCEKCHTKLVHEHPLIMVMSPTDSALSHFRGDILKEIKTIPPILHPKIPTVTKRIVVKNTGNVEWNEKCRILAANNSQKLPSLRPGEQAAIDVEIKNNGEPYHELMIKLVYGQLLMGPTYTTFIENQIEKKLFNFSDKKFSKKALNCAQILSEQFQLNEEKVRHWVIGHEHLTLPAMSNILLNNEALRVTLM